MGKSRMEFIEWSSYLSLLRIKTMKLFFKSIEFLLKYLIQIKKYGWRFWTDAKTVADLIILFYLTLFYS